MEVSVGIEVESVAVGKGGALSVGVGCVTTVHPMKNITNATKRHSQVFGC
jgi:hypothetical protein